MNLYRIDGETTYITLTQEQIAAIDVADLSLILEHRWHAHWNRNGHRFYAATGRSSRVLLMHRFLLNAQRGELVDHDDHDGLNNRRRNIAIVTNAQNLQNRAGPSLASNTGILGVSFYTAQNAYRAKVTTDGVMHRSKLFPATPEGLREAERAAIELRAKYRS